MITSKREAQAACPSLREGGSVATTAPGPVAAALSGHSACSWPRRPLGCHLPLRLRPAWTATPPAMMPGPILGPFVTAGSLPGLAPLTGLPSSFLTAEELKYADIRNIGAMITPLHFLEVKPGKRTQPVKSELDEGEERRKRRREKNKVGQPDAETRRKSRQIVCREI